MVLVLKKEVVKTNNAMEHEDTGKYRQLLVRTLHQCSVKFADVASTVIPVVCCFYIVLIWCSCIHESVTCLLNYVGFAVAHVCTAEQYSILEASIEISALGKKDFT